MTYTPKDIESIIKSELGLIVKEVQVRKRLRKLASEGRIEHSRYRRWHLTPVEVQTVLNYYRNER